MNLLEKIQQLCEQEGITIYKLEQEIKLTKGSIRKWETSSPSADKLLKVARHFNVSVEFLLDNNIANSTPYKFIKKLKSATENKLLEWSKIDCFLPGSKLEYPFNKFNLDLTEYFGKKTVACEYKLVVSPIYYAKYKEGGYLLTIILNTKSHIGFYSLFVFNNNKFSLFATDKNISMLPDLFKAVEKSVSGVDELINEFLADTDLDS